MGQLSFYSADASPPRVADLAGVLCGPGRSVGFGAGVAVRLSVTVGQRWRAVALLTAFADRGVDAVLGGSDGEWQVRTAFRADLVGLADAWSPTAPAAAPAGADRHRLDGATLRMWALAAGHWSTAGYLLGLDPARPETYRLLVTALVRAGISPALRTQVEGGPALRVSGTRRLARLVELVGVPPAGVPVHDWPAVRVAGRGRASTGMPAHRGRASIGT